MSNQWQRWKGIMKAYPFEEKRLLRWKPPYIVQPKYDGVRCRALPLQDGKYILLSSEENPIFSVPHINTQLNAFGQYLKYKGGEVPELDGELYCHGMSFDEVVSRTSRTQNLHPDHTSINYQIFDVVNESKTQLERHTDLIQLSAHFTEHLILAPFFLCESLEDIMDVYNSFVAGGYEGIIVRHLHNLYVRKRSTFVMKFKPKQSDTYLIVGYKEEISKDGNPKDRLGALVCASGDGHIFNVGTGFNNSMRQSLWLNKDKIIGKYCKVEYQHITPGNKVPRFPVFSEVIK